VLPEARAHLWGESPHDLPAHPDVLVLSDVVYDPEGYAPLVASLQALAASPETLVLMAHRSRNPMEQKFFELLSRSFSCEQIDWLSTEEAAPTASAAAGPPNAEQALHDVKIFAIRRLAAQ
jgi:predicted nicotinamide N-methyase